MTITEDIKEMVWQAFQLEMKFSDNFTTQNWNSICQYAPMISSAFLEITNLKSGDFREFLSVISASGNVRMMIFNDGFAESLMAFSKKLSSIPIPVAYEAS